MKPDEVPLRSNPISYFGENGARWHCTCGASLSTQARSVDVHCACGHVWLKRGRSITRRDRRDSSPR